MPEKDKNPYAHRSNRVAIPIDRYAQISGPTTPDGTSSKYDVRTPTNDPFYSGGFNELTPEARQSQLEAEFDFVQPWYDKLGNGAVKFAGSFASGILSIPGTIYGLGAMPFQGFNALWNNPFSEAADNLQQTINENFKNYRSSEEQNAGAWSPDHWLTMNFLADGILGNAGYAAAAWLTGGATARLLTKLAPYVATRNVKTAIDIARTGGVEALSKFSTLSSALKRFDAITKGVSSGFAAMSEASVEGYGTYRETKEKIKNNLLIKYGSEQNIPVEEMQRAEESAVNAANMAYSLNIPILTASNLFMFGKSLAGFSSEFKVAANNKIKFKALEAFGEYAESEVKKGFNRGLIRGIGKAGQFISKPIAEATEEGLQFIGSTGSKNYYSRKSDPDASVDADGFMQSFLDAGNELVTTQEGVANLLGGFGTAIAMPYSWGSMKNALFATDKKKIGDYQLQLLNSVNAKEAIKDQFESMVRHISIGKDLNKAVEENNEFEARNLLNDQMKNYIESRIRAGRFDLIESEMQQLKMMEKDEFKKFLGLDEDTEIDHTKVLTEYQEKAEDMQRVYKALDRVFVPDLYRVSEDKKEEAIKTMNAYKEMAWSYLMDAKDADGRITKLRNEVDNTFGGIVSMDNILGNKTNDDQLNNWIQQYNTLTVERKIKESSDPEYKNGKEANELKSLSMKVKRRINDYVRNNSKSFGLPEYLEKGNPEFLDEFLFDIEQQLDKLNQMPLRFGKSLMGDKSDILDVSELVSKLDDLRKLETRRMLANQSYNQLRNVIKQGKYTELVVKNPNYEEEKHKGQPKTIEENGQTVSNPEYQPEFIDNMSLLRSDSYNKFADERQSYREQKRKTEQQLADANNKLREHLNDVADSRKKGKAGIDSKLYYDAYKKYYNGNKEVTGFAHMERDEFDGLLEKWQNDINRLQLDPVYIPDTESESKFDKEKYLDLRAKVDAYRDVLKRNQAQVERMMADALNTFEKEYRERADMFGIEAADAAVEDLINARVKSSGVVDSLFIQAIRDRAEKVRAELTNEKEEEKEPKDQKDQKPIKQAATATVITNTGGSTSKTKVTGQLEPKPIEGSFTAKELMTLNNQINDVALDAYLILRRSDLKTDVAASYATIKTADTLKPGTIFRISNEQSYTVISRANDFLTASLFPNPISGKTEKFSYADLKNYGEQGLLEKAYMGNQYDKEGFVEIKQFDADLYDPESSVFLKPGRTIRLRKIKTTNENYPIVAIDVLSDSGTWVKTKMEYDLNPKNVAKAFRKEVSPEVLQAVENRIIQAVQVLNSTNVIEATLDDRNIGFGSLIFNRGDFSKRERFNLDNAFGLPFVNESDKTGGSILTVIDSDNITGADLQQMSDGKLASAADRHNAYIPQSAVDALTTNGNKAGQIAMLVPTTKIYNNQKVYIPVQLNTRDLNADMSSVATYGTGKPMNTGQMLIDVLLNPGQNEYQESMKALFTMVGLKYDPIKPNYKAFYTNENLYQIVNKVFYAAGQTIDKNVNGRFSAPFAIYTNTGEEGVDDSIRISIDITNNSGRGVRSNRQMVSVYVTYKDGNVNNLPVDDRINQFFANADIPNLVPGTTYEQLLDQIGKKAYRVDMNLASVPYSKSPKYDAIVLNEKGFLTVQQYPTYFDYLSERQIVESTIQSIKADGDRRFFFVNVPIAYTPILKTKELNVKEEATVTQTKVITRSKLAELKEQGSNVENQNKTKADIEKERQAALKDKELLAFVSPETINAKYDSELNELKKQSEPKSTDETAKTIAALSGIKTDFKGKILEDKKFTDEVNNNSFLSGLSSLRNRGKEKGSLDFNNIVTVNQFTIPKHDSVISPISKSVYKELLKYLMNAYNSNGKLNAKIGTLKFELRQQLYHKQLGLQNRFELMRKGDDVQQAALLYKQLAAIDTALRYFDFKDYTDDVLNETKVGEINGKDVHFVGFFNLAINELHKSKIVEGWAKGKDLIDFEDEDLLTYTTRFDDSWTFKIDPRNTIGKKGKLQMSLIPEWQLTNGIMEPVNDMFGEQNYLQYDTVFKTLINYGIELKADEVFQFVENIIIEPEYKANPVLRSVYEVVQDLRRNYGDFVYKQRIAEIFNPTLQQQQNQKVIELENSKRGKIVKTYDLSRQMINDEILSRWSSAFSRKLRENGYVTSALDYNKEDRAMSQLYDFALIDGMTLPSLISTKLKAAFSISERDERLTAVAEILVNDLGFAFENRGTVEGTKAILEVWDTTKKKEKAVYQKHFTRTYGRLQQMLEDTIVNNILLPMEDAIKNGTFNPQEPFRGSTTVMNSYAKALKSYFPDVINANVRDPKGKSRYAFGPRNNMSEILLQLKDINFLFELAGSSYGQYMPMLKDLFKRDVKGNLLIEGYDIDVYNKITNLYMDYFNAISNDKYKSELSKVAKKSAWNLASLLLFQNQEGDTGKSRGPADLLQVFGDATTAPYFKFEKQEFGAFIDVNSDGSYKIRVEDMTNGKPTGTFRDQLYNVFKSEINRSVHAFNRFDHLNNLKRGKAARLEKELNKGYHYIKIGQNYYPGSAMGVYLFDADVFDQMASESSPIFVTTELTSGQLVPIGFNENVVKGNALNDEYLREVFDSFFDGYITRMVDAKMQQLDTELDNLITVKTQNDTETKGLFINGFNMPLFSPQYVKRFQERMANNIVINRSDAPNTSLDQLKALDVGVQSETLFGKESDLKKESYPYLLLRAMVLDHQLHHIAFKANWTALFMADPASYANTGETFDKIKATWHKRMKQFVTPKINTVMQTGSKVRLVTYNDPKLSTIRQSFTKEALSKLSAPQKDILKFLKENPWTLYKENEDGSATMPHIFDDQIETFFASKRKMWHPSERPSLYNIKMFRRQYLSYINSKNTDGFSVITIREYLNRLQQKGQIRTKSEYNKLLVTFSKPDLDASEMADALPIQAMKYVMSGGKVDAGEIFRLYAKDADIVLLPSLTKDTEWDAIREDMEAMEGDSGAGVHLKPGSSVKIGDFHPVELFDSNGKYTGALKTATVQEWDRTVLGEQVQNPDNDNNRVSASTQMKTYDLDNLPAGLKFGEDLFSVFLTTDEQKLSEQLEQAFNSDDLQTYAELYFRKKAIEDGDLSRSYEVSGVYTSQLRRMRNSVEEELMERDLKRLLTKWDLKLEIGGADFNRALLDLGLTPDEVTPDKLTELLNSDNPLVVKQARYVYNIQKQVVAQSLDKMLMDIKNQLLQRKGITINNTYFLKVADENNATLDIPVTFSPINKMVQSILLSEINKIISGRTLPGFSFIQVPSIGMNKKGLGVGKGLKGARPIYNANGEFIGAEPAEIAISWRLRDKKGKLLDFNKYCNPDGTPKPEMWSKEMLEVIGLRIPNTGPNTAGRFKIVRFINGYKDIALIPAETMAQMNADFDFDKFNAYLYHFNIEASGKLVKIDGFLAPGQKGFEEFVGTEEAALQITRRLMMDENPDYFKKENEFQILVTNYIYEYQEDIFNEFEFEEETISALLKEPLVEKIKLLKDVMSEDQWAVLKKISTELNEMEATQHKNNKYDTAQDFIRENRKGVYQSQTDQQLENAMIQSFHISLSHPVVIEKSMTPLTTDWLEEQVTQIEYNDNQTLKDIKENTALKSLTAEVSNSGIRESNNTSDLMIGIFANAQKLLHYAQNADLTLPPDSPLIRFADKRGNYITEEKYDPETYPVSRKLYDETTEAIYNYAKGKKVFNSKDVDVFTTYPHRLGRLFARDENGNKVSTGMIVHHLLQSALDNMNNPLLGNSGITPNTVNVGLTLVMLGYADHTIPFINQPILQDYSREVLDEATSISNDKSRVVLKQEFIIRAFEKAGHSVKTLTAELNAKGIETKDLDTTGLLAAYVETLMTDTFDPSILTVQSLRNNISVPASERNNEFQGKQLVMLNQFLNISDHGQQMFELQQGLAFGSQGFKDSTIIGVHEQLNRFNQVGNLNLINVDKLVNYGSKQFSEINAARYGLRTVRNLFMYGNTGMFQDLSPAYNLMRNTVLRLSTNPKNTEESSKINNAVTKFFLSDITLLNGIAQEVYGRSMNDMAELRDELTKEDYEEKPDNNNVVRTNTKVNFRLSAASLLQKIQEQNDKTGIPYKEKYEILSNIRPFVSSDNQRMSLILYINANNYKQNLDVLMSKSIMQMLEDSNPEIQKLAKMLIMYPYVVGGTNNPNSFLIHVPQEVLAQYSFGFNIRNRMLEMNEIMSLLEREVSEMLEVTNPTVLELLNSPVKNKQAQNILKSMIYQYYQHNPYSVKSTGVLNFNDETQAFELDTDPVGPIVTRKLANGSMAIYRQVTGREYEPMDRLGYSKFNIDEYMFNEDGLPGYTVISADRRLPESSFESSNELGTIEGEDLARLELNNELKKLVGQEVAFKGTNVLPFAEGLKPSEILNDDVNGFEAPLISALDWIVGHSKVAGNPKLRESYVAVADYLKGLIPETLKYKVVTDLTDRLGRKANGLTTIVNGKVNSVQYRPLFESTYAYDVVHFKTTILHESTHAALTPIMDLLEEYVAIEKPTKEETSAFAARANVSVAKFKQQVEGFKGLQKMIEDSDIKKAIYNTLLESEERNAVGQSRSSLSKKTKQNFKVSDQAASAAARDYATGNVEEFVAHVLSDFRYRRTLNEIPYKNDHKKSLLDKVLEYFMKIFGIEKGSALESAMYDILSITEPIIGSSEMITGAPNEKASLSFGEYGFHLPFQVSASEVEERFNFKQNRC